MKSESEVAQSCLTLSDHMDCSPPGSSIHGIFQARVLEWVAIAFSIKQLTSNYTGKGGRRHRKNESFTVYEMFHRRTLCVCVHLVAQSCLTLCDPIDCSLPGSSVHGDSPGKNTEVGCHAPPPGDLPNPGIEPRSPTLQEDSLQYEPPGKPIEELYVLTKRSIDHTDDTQIICFLTILFFFPGQLLNSFSPVLLFFFFFQYFF